jgi:outer membrane protein OmpA-like peptidoglycan-associated protein
MMVTAEPHLLVRRPSSLVVLENQVREGTTTGITQPAVLQYRGFEGVYSYERESLASAPYASGDVRTEVAQARLAVVLAERAGAREFAFDQLERARGLFYRAVDALEERAAERVVTTYAHDAIRLALDAQIQSGELSFQATLDAERADFRDDIQQRDEQLRQRENDLRDLETAIEAAQSENERTRLLIERRERDLAIEREALEAARADAMFASRLAAAAEADSRRAAEEREAALARMRDALGVVADARITARGIIVSLPDILFDFNVAELKPETREILSRICGILSVTPGYRLDVEGHTDSVGTDEYNQILSEQRALSVHSYLDLCRLQGIEIRSQGFGETRPIAPNDTPDGRRQNRRVEVVVQDAQDAQ